MTRFKKSEWTSTVTKEMLREMLGDYYNDFEIELYGGWNEQMIWHFLQIKNWLYPEANARPHHHQTIVSILKEILV